MSTTCFAEDCTVKSKIVRNTKALQCEVCENWYHIKCAKVSDGLYDHLKGDNSGVHWFCFHCNVGSSKLLQVISKMKMELDAVKEEVTQLKFSNDKLEQYTRKDNAVISGLNDPHERDEDTTEKVIELANEIGVTVTRADISTSHRLGSVSATYNRPIIVRFARRDVKRALLRQRKQLKNNATHPNTFINDDLTKTRYKISKQLRVEKCRVWSHEGKILYKEDGSDDINMIDTYADFCKLQWSEHKLSELGILQ